MKKTLILGAGSSYGHGVKSTYRPPLGSEFFTHELSRILEPKYQSLFDLIKNKMKVDIKTDTIDIENFIARIESISYLLPNKTPKQIIEYTGSIDFFWVPPINTLISYIVDIISLSLNWVKDQTCPFHDYLTNELLGRTDTIVNFNYDLIVESSLLKKGSWNENSGYGFSNSKTNNQNIAVPDILLLKPHGSLNWKTLETKYTTSDTSNYPDSKNENKYNEKIAILRVKNFLNSKYQNFAPNIMKGGNDYYKTDASISLKLREIYDFNFLQPHIFYPTTNKSFERLSFGQLKIVWNKIFESIHKSDVIYSCGFSFRDKHFNEIIKNISTIRKSVMEFRIIDNNENIIEFLENEFKGYKMRFKFEAKTLQNFIEKN